MTDALLVRALSNPLTFAHTATEAEIATLAALTVKLAALTPELVGK